MTLTARRRARDMSLGECAKRAGLGSSVLSKIEYGFLRPPDDVLQKIADVLDCSLDEVKAGIPSEDAAAEAVQRLDDFAAAFATAKADAKANGYGRGVGGAGNVQCPSCRVGTIYYGVSALNGHMHASCSTPGCLRWME